MEIQQKTPINITSEIAGNDASLYSCFMKHTEKSLKAGAYGAFLLLLTHLLGYDRIISNKISLFSGVDDNISFWGFYLIVALVFLVINLYYLYIEFKTYLFTSNDWEVIKIELKKKRAVYDLGTKQKELVAIPKYVYFFFVFLFLFGNISAFDYLIISPATTLLYATNYETVFSFHKKDFTILYMFITFPPHLLLLLVIFITNLLKIKFTLSRIRRKTNGKQ